MKRIFIIIIVFIVFAGCAQKPVEKEAKTIKKIEKMSLPAWAYELPQTGDFVIGISSHSIYEDQMKDAAKQMATVIHSRNKASYTITKSAATDKEEFLSGGSAQFKLNVSSDQEETQRIYESLKLLDEYFYYEFYLALFSENSAGVTESCKTRYVANFPDWYENDGLKVEEGYVRCCASESSSNLVSAWEEASMKARFEIAKYLEKNVQSELTSENEDITKKYAIETRLKLAELKISRSYITSELCDNLRSYKVYLEMITK
ncbi:MAG: hypothetical protein Q7J16_10810 [Candidatus Cloacimonadales bacterium]|nr:hypothetical protein [Candidatus Cloacimonadales bacterium]